LKIDKDAVLVANLFAESVAQVVLTGEIKQVTIAERMEPLGLVVLGYTPLRCGSWLISSTTPSSLVL